MARGLRGGTNRVHSHPFRTTVTAIGFKIQNLLAQNEAAFLVTHTLAETGFIALYPWLNLSKRNHRHIPLRSTE